MNKNKEERDDLSLALNDIFMVNFTMISIQIKMLSGSWGELIKQMASSHYDALTWVCRQPTDHHSINIAVFNIHTHTHTHTHTDTWVAGNLLMTL